MKTLSLILLALLLSSVAALSQATGYTQTKYPIVLAHGMFGFDRLFDVSYWYGIPYALSRSGAEVYVTRVSALNSSEQRGEQLLEQVEEILAISNADKVHLIGHSHGGHSVRYVAAMLPEKVASVTAVGSPVKGSEVADLALMVKSVPVIGSALEPALIRVVEALGWLIGINNGEPLPQDARSGLTSLSLAGSADFNRRFPAGVPQTDCGEGSWQEQGQYYFSWSGVNHWSTHYLDPSSYFLMLTKLAFADDNDGLVGRCSSHFGRVIRDDYAMDHLDEVDQLYGLSYPFATNPRSIFRQHANRLMNLGL